MRSTPGVSVSGSEGSSASAQVLVATSNKEDAAAALQRIAPPLARTHADGAGSPRIGAPAVVAHPQADKVPLALGFGVIEILCAAVP